jgi:carbon-monoxide dehydrogenase medium subunit
VKPAPFDLHQPATLADAASLLAEYGDDAKPLAGGQSLVPMLALRLTRFDHLVDLNGVEGFADITDDDDELRIGAGARQAAVGRDPRVARHAPLITRATPLIGHFQIRNRGTIGGSVAHADPASEYPATVLALDAELEVTSTRGTRRVPAADFFTGTWTTVLESDELLSAIVVPKVSPGANRRGVAIDEVARRNGDFALAGAVAIVDVDPQHRITSAAISMFGMSSTPVRAPEAERALVGSAATETDHSEIARLAVDPTDPPEDVHATSAYRKRIAVHLVERVLTRALEEATDAAR